MDGCPVFDHYDPALAGEPFWAVLRDLQSRGPLCWVDSYGGYWAVTSYDLVVKMAQDWRTFSSAEGISINRPAPDVMPYIMPLEKDPPRQREFRQWINPHLTVRALADMDDAIREATNAVIDEFAADGHCDIVTGFTRVMPGTVLFRLLMRCAEDSLRTVEPASRAISFSPDPVRIAEGSAQMRAWAAQMLAGRGAAEDPHGVVDAVRRLAESGIDVADDEYLTAIQILIQGGIGTAASATGTIVRVLAEDPALQARVREDPSLVPALVEEGIRLEAPTAMLFRTATRDVEIEGQQIHAGDKVALILGAANRDPSVFERPDDVELERPHNRHLSFGAGVHRCIGSNLARMEICIFIEQLLARIGPFRIPEGAEIKYYTGQTRGLASMPLEFEPVVGAGV